MNIKSKSTLKRLENILRFKNYSENSIRIYLYYNKEFLLSFNKDIYHINKKETIEYIINYNYTSISQQNQIISSIKLLYKFILNVNLNNIKIERPRKEKILPKIIDKNHILNNCSKINNLKHKTLILLAYSVGLRVSEIINLKLKDIDSKRMIININQAKGRKDRIVPLTENILKLLREYYLEYKPKEYLFNGQNKLQYSSTSCNNIVKKYLGNDYHFHLLRHSCFTNLTEQNVDIRIIQKLAGHSSSKTTEIYTHVSKNTLKKLPLAI